MIKEESQRDQHALVPVITEARSFPTECLNHVLLVISINTGVGLKIPWLLTELSGVSEMLGWDFIPKIQEPGLSPGPSRAMPPLHWCCFWGHKGSGPSFLCGRFCIVYTSSSLQNLWVPTVDSVHSALVHGRFRKRPSKPSPYCLG